jgi:hypothetical protein
MKTVCSLRINYYTECLRARSQPCTLEVVLAHLLGRQPQAFCRKYRGGELIKVLLLEIFYDLVTYYASIFIIPVPHITAAD